MAAEKPNIVYILADDLGYGDVQALNPAGKIATPHMDRLAREGVAVAVFVRVVSSGSVAEYEHWADPPAAIEAIVVWLPAAASQSTVAAIPPVRLSATDTFVAAMGAGLLTVMVPVTA